MFITSKYYSQSNPPGHHRMISSFAIRNFRCYRNLEIDNCSRLNVIVGESGSGKTTLLEAIFLPLATSTEVAMRLRQIRGLDPLFSGPARRLEEALWGDFFFDGNLDNPVLITLRGDGPETRSLEISRGVHAQAILPLSGGTNTTLSSQVVFTWTDANGNKYPLTPRIGPAGVTLPDTGETIPDFFFCPSTGALGSVDSATRLSELSKSNRQKKFIQIFTKEYPWIKDLNVEVHAGSPTIFASLKDSSNKIPLANVSGGINRAVSIMLTISNRPDGVVLADEFENGIYYSHLTSVWRSTLDLLREYKTQMFVTTHSRECLVALIKAAGKDVDDISLWRTERTSKGYIVRQFTGQDFRAGIEYNTDVR